MSELNDPRVLFAAERTLLAWNRTVSGLIALGFLIDRASLMVDRSGVDRKAGLWIGMAFLMVGVVLSVLSAVQYRKSIATLRPIEVPPNYWPNLAVVSSVALTVLAVFLALYMVTAP